MLRLINLTHGEMSDAALAWAKDNVHGVVMWAPAWPVIEPRAGAVDVAACHIADADYARIRTAGLKVLMCCPSGYPTWSYPGRSAKHGGAHGGLPPDDLSPQGPWASHYIRLLMQRYPMTVALVPMNEPNDAHWRALHQDYCDAQMMRAAAQIAAQTKYQGWVIGPAYSDGDRAYPLKHFQNYLRWMNFPYGRLRAYKPPPGVKFGVAHHFYTDVNHGQVSRTQGMLNLMKQYRWPQSIWLTEGGFMFRLKGPRTWNSGEAIYDPPEATQEQTQLLHIKAHMEWSRNTSMVMCWANYEWRTFEWYGWDTGMLRRDGTPRPILQHYKTL